MAKHKRAIVVAEADLHGGSDLGLLNPKTLLSGTNRNKYYPALNENQELLWEIREWGRKETIKLAENDPIVLLQVGDVNQGLVFEVSNSLFAQSEIALMNIKPWLDAKNLVAVRIAEGTSVHSFGEGDAEELLVSRIKETYPKIDVRMVNHGQIEVFGVVIEYAHHGPYTGSREWLKGNVAYLDLKSRMMRELLRHRKPSDVYLFGHYHSFVKAFCCMEGEKDKDYESWLFVLASLCMLGSHARKITKSEFEITNGILAMEIVDGRIRETFKFAKTTDTRTKEKIL